LSDLTSIIYFFWYKNLIKVHDWESHQNIWLEITKCPERKRKV